MCLTHWMPVLICLSLRRCQRNNFLEEIIFLFYIFSFTFILIVFITSLNNSLTEKCIYSKFLSSRLVEKFYRCRMRHLFLCSTWILTPVNVWNWMRKHGNSFTTRGRWVSTEWKIRQVCRFRASTSRYHCFSVLLFKEKNNYLTWTFIFACCFLKLLVTSDDEDYITETASK